MRVALGLGAVEAEGRHPAVIAVVASVGFTALHLPGWVAMQGVSTALVTQAASVMVVGLLCGAGRALTGSTWAAVILHAVNNAASTGVFRL